MKNILYIGCVESSYYLLEALLENNYEICGIITMDSSPINSDFHSLVSIADNYNIDCFITNNINNHETIEFIKSKSPDIIYCFGWSKLISEEILNISPSGVIGFHPAALPNNRGRHPIIWALALGLQKTASTFFIMDKNADTGDIISQVIIPIDYSDDAHTLYMKILKSAKDQVLEFTSQYLKQELIGTPQNDIGNSWRKRNRIDGQIDWRMSSRGIYNLVRALTHPYAGAHFIYNGNDIKVWKCEEIPSDNYSNIEPGKVIKVISSTNYYVKAYDGIIHVIDSEETNLTQGEYLL